MANGLFTPEQVIDAERRARMSRDREMLRAGIPYGGAGVEIGRSLGRGIGGLFGVKPRESSALQLARKRQEALKGIDFTDRESLIRASRSLVAAGDLTGANQLASQALSIEVPEEPEEQFNTLKRLGKYGDKVVVALEGTEGSLKDLKLVDTELYENMRARLAKKDKAPPLPGIPAEPTKRGVKAVQEMIKAEDDQWEELLGFDLTRMDDDEFVNFARRVEAVAQRLQSEAKVSGKALDSDTARRLAVEEVAGDVAYDPHFKIFGFNVPYTEDVEFAPGGKIIGSGTKEPPPDDPPDDPPGKKRRKVTIDDLR